jgi:hypothetical protein
MESLVPLAITGTECIANRQTDILLYIYRLAEVPDTAQKNSVLYVWHARKIFFVVSYDLLISNVIKFTQTCFPLFDSFSYFDIMPLVNSFSGQF